MKTVLPATATVADELLARVDELDVAAARVALGVLHGLVDLRILP